MNTRRGGANSGSGGRTGMKDGGSGGSDKDGRTTENKANAMSPEKTKDRTKTEVRKQTTLEGFRKVKFEDDEKFKEMKSKLAEDLAKIRQERVEIEKVKLDLKAWEISVMERVDSIETRFRELEEREKAREARIDALEEKFFEWPRDGDTVSENDAASVASGATFRSRASRRSAASVAGSVCLSEKEVTGMKRLLYEQDRKSRQENFVVKGILPGVVNNESVLEWTQELIKSRLGLEIKILQARMSGRVIVARVGSVEEKLKIMKNKSKLAGSKVFIEYDLSFEDRKIQEEINRWIKGIREKGIAVKSGSKRVLINNVWVFWDNKEKLEEMVKEAEKKKKEEQASSERRNPSGRRQDLA